MDLSHEFDVAVPPEHAWGFFTDLSRVIPNLPGAGLEGMDGDVTLGKVKVKVGPVTAQYKGKAWFLEQDAAARRMQVRAEGRDARGQGNAKATITVELSPAEEGTHARVDVDMQITGKIAQIGRGLIADVSERLMGEFVKNLEVELADEAVSPAPVGAEADEVGASLAESAEEANLAEPAEPVPVDLLASAGAPIAKRLRTVVVVVAVGFGLWWLLG